LTERKAPVSAFGYSVAIRPGVLRTGYEMKPDLAAYYGEARLPRYTSYPTAPHFSSAIGPAS
jgi:hypothetical protein